MDHDIHQYHHDAMAGEVLDDYFRHNVPPVMYLYQFRGMDQVFGVALDRQDRLLLMDGSKVMYVAVMYVVMISAVDDNSCYYSSG